MTTEDKINVFCLMNLEISELPLNNQEKLKFDQLVEQDKCFSEFEYIDGVSIWEKGNEQICKDLNGNPSYVRLKFKDEKIPEQHGGLSFFHKIGEKEWHVRIHKGE